MAQLIWSVLCHKGLLDSYTNQVSLLDVIEQVTIRGPEPPPFGGKHALVPISMVLVSLWRRSALDTPEKFQTRMIVHTPDGKKISAKEMVADILAVPKTRTFMRLEAFPYRGPGNYELEVQHRPDVSAAWQTATKVPLDIFFERISDPSATQPPTPRTRRSRRGASR